MCLINSKYKAIINQPVTDKRMESLAGFNHIVRPSLGQQLTLNCVFKCRLTGNKNTCKQKYQEDTLFSSASFPYIISHDKQCKAGSFTMLSGRKTETHAWSGKWRHHAP